MVKILSHDIRAPLVSMAAVLKLVNKGVYGKMDESVASELRKLFELITGSIGTLEDFVGKALSLDGGLDLGDKVVDLKEDV